MSVLNRSATNAVVSDGVRPAVFVFCRDTAAVGRRHGRLRLGAALEVDDGRQAAGKDTGRVGRNFTMRIVVICAAKVRGELSFTRFSEWFLLGFNAP